MYIAARALALALAFGVASSTEAHHSYAMFDGRTGGHFRLATRVDGTVIRGAGGPCAVDGNLATAGAQ